MDSNTGGYFSGSRWDYVGAVDYVVTSLDDTLVHGDDTTVRSLREAIETATGPGSPEIWAPGWHFLLAMEGSGDIAQGDFDIWSTMTIRGTGAGQTIIDAAALRRTSFSDRIFDVQHLGWLNLRGVTLTGGRAPADATQGSGGAVYVRNSGTLAVEYSAIIGNQAITSTGQGGGIFFENYSGGFIINSVITANHAGNSTGGVYLQAQDPPSSNVFVSNSIIVNNSDSDATMTRDDVYAGGFRNFLSKGYNRVGNAANGLTDGVNGDYIKPVGTTVHYIVTRTGDTLNHVDDSVALSLREAIENAEITPGTQEIWLPGWRFPLRLSGSGGVSQGDFDIATAMTIRGIGPGETIIDGSGIADRHFDIASGGTLDLSHLTLALGIAPNPSTERDGGAIRVRDGGHLVLGYSAIVGNTTGQVGEGGGIYFAPTGSGAISNSVITVNEADYETGGIYLRDATTPGLDDVTIVNSIVANNTDSSGFAPDMYAGWNRKIISGGNNRYTSTPVGFQASGGDYLGSVNYVVTGVADTFDGTSDPIVMSQRDAIHLANTTAGAQEIWLPAWGFILTNVRSGQATDTEVSYGDLDIHQSLTIRGISGSTSVAWRTGEIPGAIIDKVFELVGDYNSDNIVDPRDDVVWRGALATQNLAADGDDDGDVDQDDYNVWYSHYGNTLVTDGVTVS